MSTEQYAQVTLELVDPSKTNPRHHFPPGYLDELAGSIKDKGVLQPILLRPGAKGRFEIVAGECRTRASKLAGLTHIPAIIRTLTDEQVLEIQLVENIHRQDLTPLEEARGYRQLITANPTKHSAESIATRIGMSPAYVWDRLKLNDLTADAKKILESGLMTVGHAILIARLKPEDQARVITIDSEGYYCTKSGLWEDDDGRLDYDEDDPRAAKKKRGPYDGFKAVSVRELDRWIHDHIRFDVDHMAKAQPLAFEATAVTVMAATEQPGRRKKVISITHEYRVADDARDAQERTYGSQSWERADGLEKSKTCEHSVLGVVVAGPGYGDTLQVCVARDKCDVHFGKVIREREKNQKLRANGKSQEAEASESAAHAREKQAREQKEARWKVFSVALEKAMRAAAQRLPAALPEAVHAHALKIAGVPASTKPADLARAIIRAHIDSEFRYASAWNETKLVAFAKTLGVDVKACEPKPAVQTSGAAKAKKAGK